MASKYSSLLDTYQLKSTEKEVQMEKHFVASIINAQWMVKFLFLEGHNGLEIHDRLVSTLGKEALNEDTVGEYCEGFKNGGWSIENQWDYEPM